MYSELVFSLSWPTFWVDSTLRGRFIDDIIPMNVDQTSEKEHKLNPAKKFYLLSLNQIGQM